jgi:hypothetical protein
VIPDGTLAGRRGVGTGGALVRVSAGLAGRPGVLGLDARVLGVLVVGVLVVGARVMGVSALLVDGRARGERGLVAGVILPGKGSRDVRQEAAGRVARERVVLNRVAQGRVARERGARERVVLNRVARGPVAMGRVVVGRVVVGRVVLGSLAAMGSSVVLGAGRGSEALGAGPAEAGRPVGPRENGRAGRAQPGTAREPGRIGERHRGAGRGHGPNGVGMVTGTAAGALASVRTPPGAGAMAQRAGKALEHRAAADQDHGGSRVLHATIGTHGGHPAGGGWSSRRGLVLSNSIRRPGPSFGRYRATWRMRWRRGWSPPRPNPIRTVPTNLRLRHASWRPGWVWYARRRGWRRTAPGGGPTPLPSCALRTGSPGGPATCR